MIQFLGSNVAVLPSMNLMIIPVSTIPSKLTGSWTIERILFNSYSTLRVVGCVGLKSFKYFIYDLFLPFGIFYNFFTLSVCFILFVLSSRVDEVDSWIKCKNMGALVQDKLLTVFRRKIAQGFALGKVQHIYPRR